MNRLKQLKTHPFGLLLCLEWILLCSSILGELPDSFLWQQYYKPSSTSIFWSPLLVFICLLILGLMGLNLPQKNRLNKWLYLILQLGLIWLPTIVKEQDLLFFIPFLIVSMRNCLIFRSRECWFANLLVFISFIPTLTFLSSFEDFQLAVSQFQTISLEEFVIRRNISNLSLLFFIALLIVFTYILVEALLREYKTQQKLDIAREQLREYALKAEDRATVHERNRIAREIHDSVGHVLTAQTIQLNNAIAFWQVDSDRSYQFIVEAKELVATALKEIRYSINTLRSDPLEGKSLENALKLLLQDFSARTKINPEYTINLNHQISEEIKFTIYRVIQESLTNIIKHSEASQLKLELQTYPQYLYLLIKDNGKGFNPELNTTGFGLQGIKERIASINGNLQIDSGLDSGCAIAIKIPL